MGVAASTGEAEEYEETREKLEMIRVKFLRVAKRFGQTPDNGVVAHILDRLGLTELLSGRNGGSVGGFSYDRASAMAEQLESAGEEPLDFSCTIMVLGKTGVGKSSTINSIFDEVKFNTDAFHMGTKKVQDVVGTIQASAPPDGPNGTPSSYDMFVKQRSLVVQQAIHQAAGDMRLMNPVSLVENQCACRTNTAGQRVLPNGQIWKPNLLLLSFALKILAEANALLKLQDNPHEKPYTARARAPPLSFLLSSFLQSRRQLKLPEEQFRDDDDDGLNDESSDYGDETDPDDLPPFKPLTKAQIKNLSKALKKAYLDEVEYRETLFMKKQLKYEKKQRKMMKEMAESVKDLPNEYGENVKEESEGAASVPAPMPDRYLPANTSLDFDMQTVGEDLAYTLRSETKFLNFRRNKATVVLSFTLLGDALSACFKVEDKLIANKRFKLVIAAGGAMNGRDDVAYGGSLEA
ncbi:hypothetical protein TSUD_397700 [Trifolium subterraneum]|uniref:AIG1-type G domain-containing protein n=1 Tax=Trifolium subterraneum TaxID=3900 RepID=A0A2Z6N6Z8_TRISU|nr:hypothetical protein TSUD_397700 [Trifolium subterraneum]